MEELHLVVFNILILCGLIFDSESCSCMNSHPQTQFCRADFVIKAKVKGVDQRWKEKNYEPIGKKVTLKRDKQSFKIRRYEKGRTVWRSWNRQPYQIRYNINIMKIYRGEDILKNISTKYLYTAANEAMCGVKLHTGIKYIIMGRVNNGKAETDMCRYIRDWATLHFKERKALHLYAKQCDHCQVKTCWRRCTHTQNSCSLDGDHFAQDCYSRSVCIKHISGACRWTRSKLFRLCYKTKKREYYSIP